jgi:hypothetical protein
MGPLGRYVTAEHSISVESAPILRDMAVLGMRRPTKRPTSRSIDETGVDEGRAAEAVIATGRAEDAIEPDGALLEALLRDPEPVERVGKAEGLVSPLLLMAAQQTYVGPDRISTFVADESSPSGVE